MFVGPVGVGLTLEVLEVNELVVVLVVELVVVLVVVLVVELVVELVEAVVVRTKLFVYTDNLFPAPQSSVPSPAQGKLQSVAGAATDPGLNVFPQ